MKLWLGDICRFSRAATMIFPLATAVNPLPVGVAWPFLSSAHASWAAKLKNDVAIRCRGFGGDGNEDQTL